MPRVHGKAVLLAAFFSILTLFYVILPSDVFSPSSLKNYSKHKEAPLPPGVPPTIDKSDNGNKAAENVSPFNVPKPNYILPIQGKPDLSQYTQDSLRPDLPWDPNVRASPSKIREHFKEVFRIFQRGNPNLRENLTDYSANGKAPFVTAEEPYTEAFLSKFLSVKDDQIKNLTRAHELVLKELPRNGPRDLYKGSGVTYVGGGNFMASAVHAVKMFRNTNQDLPIEVMVETPATYEKDICEKVLPALNARCVVISDILGPEICRNFTFRGFHYKALALLTSSFDNTILLDADNFPVTDPAPIFESDPFKETGMILWPDWWRRTVSPAFFKVVNIKVGERVRGDMSVTDLKKVPYSDRERSLPGMSTESGQIAIRKTRHHRTLLLSLYYNIYGYDIYYPLLSQGAQGEGDKETFAAAAVVNDDPIYYLNSSTHATGYWANNDYTGFSILQNDPQEDWMYNQYKIHSKGDFNREPRIMFIHNNVKKINPPYLFEIHRSLRERMPLAPILTDEETKGKTDEEKGQLFLEKSREQDKYRMRYHGNLDEVGNRLGPGYDIELYIWEAAEWEICYVALELNMPIKQWNDTYGTDKIKEACERIQRHVDWLRVTPSQAYLRLPFEIEEEKKAKEEQEAREKEEREKKEKEEREKKEKEEREKKEKEEKDKRASAAATATASPSASASATGVNRQQSEEDKIKNKVKAAVESNKPQNDEGRAKAEQEKALADRAKEKADIKADKLVREEAKKDLESQANAAERAFEKQLKEGAKKE